jgi:flagellar hook-length control protein FliK
VASPLTISSTTGLGAGKAPAASASAGADDGRDVFAAMLGETDRKVPPARTTPQSNADTAAPAAGQDGAGQMEDPEAIAAAIDALAPVQQMVTSGEMLTSIIDGLAALKARLAAGEPLDPEALKALQDALEAFAGAAGIALDTLPSFEELAAMANGALADPANPANPLTAALAPLAQTLLGSTEETDFAAELKSLGERLAAMLKALNDGAIDTEQLGLSADTGLDAELEAALTRLANAAPKVDATTPPALATPELKLTEPVLTGRTAIDAPADAESDGATAQATAPATGANRDRTGEDTADARAGERRSDAAAAPTTAVDPATADAQATTQSAPSARADIVAAPRVVQAGYQTSQQQLNLPQIAFELVRQVNEGNTRFQIRLDPPELGRIDVRLDIDASGQVNARLTVEKAETLDLMQRDQRALQQALQQAGLDGAKTNLEFSLKQNPFGGGQQGQDGDSPLLFGDDGSAEDDAVPPTVNLYRGNLSASGVNIIA